MDLPSKHFRNVSKKIPVGPGFIGGEAFSVIAGPCSVESYAQLSEIAQGVKEAGACMLRGGIYKMRTRPDSFQGLGRDAFEIAKQIRRETGLAMVSEVTDPSQIELLVDVVDVLQVGARNMHNTELLKALGKAGKPILLKRGLSAYLDELLSAAEYIVRSGNDQVILSVRGVRSFEPATRNTLDLAAVPYLKSRSRLPVLVDPSHGTGVSLLVPSMCLAAAAAGADGLLIEVHDRPEVAVSDGFQALDLKTFGAMMKSLARILEAMDRPLAKPVPESHPMKPVRLEPASALRV